MVHPDQLREAAERFGTPLYVYDAAELDAALARVRLAFGPARVFYAMKANPNLTLLGRWRGAGVGFECVSPGEIARARHLGLRGERLIVNGPAKSLPEYAAAHELGACLVVDRPEEIGLLPPGSRVLVRVNPALEVSTHAHLATGAQASKFGVPLAEAAQVVSALRRAGQQVLGLHVHIGSAIRDAGDFARAFGKVTALRGAVGELEVLDVGGGWSLGADLGGIAAEAWAAARHFGAELWVEPGRYLVAGAGTLLCRVAGTKRAGRQFCLVDAGMTELIRPMLYGAAHPVTPLWDGAGRGEPQLWDIAGPACESGDLYASGVALPQPQRGDLLAVGEAGAYGASMSSHYLTRPRPAEALLDGQHWQLIRRRETPQELWQSELLTAEG